MTKVKKKMSAYGKVALLKRLLNRNAPSGEIDDACKEVADMIELAKDEEMFYEFPLEVVFKIIEKCCLDASKDEDFEIIESIIRNALLKYQNNDVDVLINSFFSFNMNLTQKMKLVSFMNAGNRNINLLLIMQTINCLNDEFQKKQTELENRMNEKINKLEEENTKIREELSNKQRELENSNAENSRRILNLENSLNGAKKRLNNLERNNASLDTKINIKENDLKNEMNRKIQSIEEGRRELVTKQDEIISKVENFDEKIKKSVTPFLPLIEQNKPTSLTFLKTKYPFLNDKVNVLMQGRWYMKIGIKIGEKCPSGDCYRLLIEGEEEIHFKNAATGETGEKLNMFYAGELDGNPLVALRRCSDRKFRCIKSKDDCTRVWKNNIESFDDLYTLKKIE